MVHHQTGSLEVPSDHSAGDVTQMGQKLQKEAHRKFWEE